MSPLCTSKVEENTPIHSLNCDATKTKLPLTQKGMKESSFFSLVSF